MHQLRFWSPYFHWAVPYYQSSSVFTAFWSLEKNKNRPFCRFPLVGIHREWRKNAYSLTDRWMDTNHPVHSAQKKSIHLSIQRIYFHLSDFSFAGIHCGEIWDAKELLLDLQTLPLFYVNAAYQVSLGFLYILKYSLFTLPQIEIPLFLQIKLISKMSCGHTPFRILLLYLTVNRCFSTAHLFQELFCINLKPTKG